MRSAHRLARTIGLIKWVALLVPALIMLAALTTGNQYVSVAMIVTSALAAVVVFVVFGWSKHALRMLAIIADGAAESPLRLRNW